MGSSSSGRGDTNKNRRSRKWRRTGEGGEEEE